MRHHRHHLALLLALMAAIVVIFVLAHACQPAPVPTPSPTPAVAQTVAPTPPPSPTPAPTVSVIAECRADAHDEPEGQREAHAPAHEHRAMTTKEISTFASRHFLWHCNQARRANGKPYLRRDLVLDVEARVSARPTSCTDFRHDIALRHGTQPLRSVRRDPRLDERPRQRRPVADRRLHGVARSTAP